MSSDVRGRSWTGYAAVYLILFLIGTETFLVSPLLPTISSALGVSEAAAATSVSAYTLVYAVTAPFLGAVSDRFGRRPTIVAGAVLFLLSNVLAALAPSLAVLVAARVLGALGAALAGPSIWAHIAETADDASRGRAIGYGMAAFSSGQIVGIPVGGLIAGAGDWRSPFWALAAVTAVTVPLLYRQVPAPRAVTAGGAPLRGVFSVWGDAGLRHVLIVVFLLQAANLGAYTFLGAALHDRFGLSVDALGLLGVLVGIGSVLGSLAAPRLADRTGRPGGLVALWCLVLGGGAVLAALGAPLWVALAAVLVWFFASGAFGTDVQTILVTRRPDLGATSSSWNSAVLYIGTTAGVALAGLAATASAGVALVGGGLALLAAVTALPLASARADRAVVETGARS